MNIINLAAYVFIYHREDKNLEVGICKNFCLKLA